MRAAQGAGQGREGQGGQGRAEQASLSRLLSTAFVPIDTLATELNQRQVLTCTVEHLVFLVGQQPRGAASRTAHPHAVGCRSPAAGTSEESPVQTHISRLAARLYMLSLIFASKL